MVMQTVLLRGVNDNTTSLFNLFLTAASHGIIPYYLHQLDRVFGANHFEVEEGHGLQLVKALRARLPGYAVPRYVLEKPGKRSKTPITD